MLSASGQLRRAGLPPYDTPAPEGRGSLLLRIKVEDEPHSDRFTQTHYYSATHCFQYALRRWGVEDMDEIDCPPARPIIVPTEPSAPPLMPGSDRGPLMACRWSILAWPGDVLCLSHSSVGLGAFSGVCGGVALVGQMVPLGCVHVTGVGGAVSTVGDSFAFVGGDFSLIGQAFTLVCDPVSVVCDLIAQVSHAVTLGRVLGSSRIRSCLACSGCTSSVDGCASPLSMVGCA